MKLSIIIPVYNVEPYLERCVESVLNQNLSEDDYEILLINDGSTDNSGIIAQKLSQKKTNIKYTQQENKGLGGARNTGIKNAQGDYILLLDSDDWLDHNVLNHLLEVAFYKDLDLLIFKMKRFYNTEKVVETEINYQCKEVITGRDFILQNRLEIQPCTALYRRELLIQNNINFIENFFYEDVDFYLKVLLHSQRVYYLPKAIYNYFYNEKSITINTETKHNEKKIAHYGNALLRIAKVKDQQPLDVQKRIEFIMEKYMRWWMMMIYRNEINYNAVSDVFKNLESYGIYPFQLRQNILDKNEKAQLWYFNNLINNPVGFKHRYKGAILCMKINNKLNLIKK